MRHVLVGYHGSVHGLTGSVKAAVGEYVINVLRHLVFIERESAAKPLLGAGIVLVRVDVYLVRLSLIPFIFSLTATVGGQRVQFFAVISIIGVRCQSDLGTRHRPTRRGIDGHQPDAVVGQRLMHHVEVAHVQQHALRAHVLALG